MMARETIAAWRRLLWIGRLEAITLLLLIGVAVPIKYALGVTAGTRLMGPVHGVVFLAYLWCAVEAAAAAVDEPQFARLPLWRLMALGLVPFGTLLIDRDVRQRLARATPGTSYDAAGAAAAGDPPGGAAE